MSYLMIDLQGLELSDEESTWLKDPRVCGAILFSRNYQSPQQVIALNQAIREAAGKPVIIAVDQEGGRVQRCRDGVTRFPAMRDLVAFRGISPQLLKDAGWLLAAEMVALGFDMSFTPVLDIDYGVSQVIGDRAFGGSAQQVVENVQYFIQGMNDAGMAATAKHFPGHGHVEADSHHALPVDTRSYKEIEDTCLLPFSLLSHTYQAVMPAHVLYQNVDAVMPAGFSSFWLQDILRKKLEFSGVIFSDDLTMQGAQAFGDISQTAVMAEKAGCDVLLICNSPDTIRAYLKTANPEATGQQYERICSLQAKQVFTLEQITQMPRALGVKQLLDDNSER